MFPQWKLIFQKTRIKNLTLILFVVLFVILVVGFMDDSCSVDNFVITNEISSYEKSLDPELCENILEQIDSYNDMCTSQIEILDCG
jgi:hypothetical protein